MKLVLELYDKKFTVEAERDDYTAEDLKEIFSRLLVQAGFLPDVLEPVGGGCYECVFKEEE